VEAGELERIKAQVVAEKVYEQDSMFYQAMQMGMLETIGVDWRVHDEYVKRIRDITPGQLQAVARKYLVDDHLTVAVLEPQTLKVTQSTNGGAHATH
jgi:zinc protease